MAAEIIKCERVSHPPVRFIGKRYDTYPNWNDFWANNWFEEIESIGERADINDGSYCVLTGYVNGEPEHYLGEFFPEGTLVPGGFDFADLPAMDAALFFIKGLQNECYDMVIAKRDRLNAAMTERGMTPPETQLRWLSFERDNCPRWTDPDTEGRQILDYAIYLG